MRLGLTKPTVITICIDGCRSEASEAKACGSHKALQRTVLPGCGDWADCVLCHLPPLCSQEEDFVRPSSREEAQQLWEAERLKMRQLLDKQQKQMVEDYQWLRQEEKALVRRKPSQGRERTCPDTTAGHLLF